jgi:catechol 2,3-dioxygenase-like lactoylglutathione lyase family enzyme
MARLFNVTFNVGDPVALGRFWSEALGYRIVTEGPDLVRLASGDAGPDLLLLRVDEPSSSSVVHLDLAVVDPLAEVDRLVELGARSIDVSTDGEPAARTANGISWYVLADPEGNEFCVGGEP